MCWKALTLMMTSLNALSLVKMQQDMRLNHSRVVQMLDQSKTPPIMTQKND